MAFPATMICLSLAEWTQWIHQGAIYLHISRFRNIAGPDDYDAFQRLLLSAHDAGTGDDQSYIVTSLCDDVSDRVDFVGKAPFEFVSLTVEAAISFQVASNRGHVLLQAEAERMGVRLASPVFEQLWRRWCAQRDEERKYARGYRLIEALGLSRPQARPRWFSILEDPEFIPLARQDDLQKLERSSAWGFCVALIKYAVREQASAQNPEHPLIKRASALVKQLRDSGRIEEFDLIASGICEVAAEIDDLNSPGNECLLPPFLVFSVVAHFRHAFSESNIDPEKLWLSFGAALSCIANSYGRDKAAECAYAVGCSMQDVAVSEVLYAAYPARFPALSASGIPFDPLGLVKFQDVPPSATAETDNDQRTSVEEVSVEAAQRAISLDGAADVAALAPSVDSAADSLVVEADTLHTPVQPGPIATLVARENGPPRVAPNGETNASVSNQPKNRKPRKNVAEGTTEAKVDPISVHQTVGVQLSEDQKAAPESDFGVTEQASLFQMPAVDTREVLQANTNDVSGTLPAVGNTADESLADAGPKTDASSG